MAFVNEYISAEDFLTYGIEAIDMQYWNTTLRSRQWTIDRERNIYLRAVASGKDELSHIATWTFYWKGDLLWSQREGVAFRGKPGEPCWSHTKVSKLVLPPHLQSNQQEIHQALRDAFFSYRDGGVYATCTEFSMQLDIEVQFQSTEIT